MCVWRPWDWLTILLAYSSMGVCASANCLQWDRYRIQTNIPKTDLNNKTKSCQSKKLTSFVKPVKSKALGTSCRMWKVKCCPSSTAVPLQMGLCTCESQVTQTSRFQYHNVNLRSQGNTTQLRFLQSNCSFRNLDVTASSWCQNDPTATSCRPTHCTGDGPCALGSVCLLITCTEFQCQWPQKV